MEEQIVSFKTAKIANKNGFGFIQSYGQGSSLYNKNGKHTYYMNYGFMYSGLYEGYISAPTQGFLSKWLREKHNILVVPIYGYHDNSIDSYIKSKLVESWVRVPLFLEYQTAQKKWKQFHFAVGGVFGYKIGSHSKQVHFADGDRNKPKVYNDFYLNPIKLDAEVRVGWGPINLFASYALTQMFKENKGPELYPYTVGVTLASW